MKSSKPGLRASSLLRVHGLANIGALLDRGDLPKAPPPAPKRERRTRDEIISRTMEKIGAAVGGNATATQMSLVREYVNAAVRDAHSLGHAEALDQNHAVERLLDQQYEARTKLTMPAVAAGIMEQLNMPSMTLDLALMASVFKRNQIDFSLSNQDVIEYTLLPLPSESSAEG